MAPVIIELSYEMPSGSFPPSELDRVRDSAAAELAVIAQDLRLDADFRLDIRMAPDEGGRAGSSSRLVLHVDGNTFLAYGRRVPEVLRACMDELVGARLVNHMWQEWGGNSVAPPAFQTLVRDLVRYRIRPDRVSHAVAVWSDQDALRLFEDAMGQVSRKICVHVHPARAAELTTAFAAEKGSAASSMADDLFYELGVVLGQCELVLDPTQATDSIRLRINDLRSGAMPLLASNECAVNDTVDRLTLLDIKGQEAVNPANGSECAIIPKAHANMAEQAGLTTWDTAGWAISGISAEVRRAAAALLSLDAVQSQLDKLGTASPYLVSHVRSRIGEERFARVLRLLLAEGIWIRNMRHIINALALRSPPAAAPIDYSKFIVFGSTYSGFSVNAAHCGNPALDALAMEMSEQIRGSLKRYISHKYTRGGNTLIVYLVDPKIEGRLADRQPLSAPERSRLLEAVHAEVGDLPPTAQAPCVLTLIGIRRRLRSVLEASFPNLVVLSYQDLSPDMNIQPIARISAQNMFEAGR